MLEDKKLIKDIRTLVFFIIGYLSILIITKLNIIDYILKIVNVITPLFIGIVIAWLFSPLIDFLEKKKLSRAISLVIIYLLILLLIYILFITFVPKFINEFDEFVSLAPNIIDRLFNMIKLKFIDINSLKAEIMCIMDKFSIKIVKGMPNTCIVILKEISDALIGLIIGFYLLMSNFDIDEYVKKNTSKLLRKINIILRNYVKGTLLTSFIVFILSTLSFYFVGLPNSLLFGFICGITNIIPFIGPYIGACIPVLVSFTKNITFGIIVSVIILVIQTIEGNIIHPLIMSKSVNVHPVTSIVSLLIFGYFFGIVGMILAVPIVAIIKELYLFFLK